MEPRPGTSSRADPGPERPPRQTPGTPAAPHAWGMLNDMQWLASSDSEEETEVGISDDDLHRDSTSEAGSTDTEMFEAGLMDAATPPARPPAERQGSPTPADAQGSCGGGPVGEEEAEAGGGGDVCAVCTDEIAPPLRCQSFPCLHPFCIPCMKTWIPLRNTCPLCNTPVAYLIVGVTASGSFSTIPIVNDPRTRVEAEAAVRAGTAVDFIWTGNQRTAPRSLSLGGHTVRALSPTPPWPGTDDEDDDLADVDYVPPAPRRAPRRGGGGAGATRGTSQPAATRPAPPGAPRSSSSGGAPLRAGVGSGSGGGPAVAAVVPRVASLPPAAGGGRAQARRVGEDAAAAEGRTPPARQPRAAQEPPIVISDSPPPSPRRPAGPGPLSFFSSSSAQVSSGPGGGGLPQSSGRAARPRAAVAPRVRSPPRAAAAPVVSASADAAGPAPPAVPVDAHRAPRSRMTQAQTDTQAQSLGRAGATDARGSGGPGAEGGPGVPRGTNTPGAAPHAAEGAAARPRKRRGSDSGPAASSSASSSAAPRSPLAPQGVGAKRAAPRRAPDSDSGDRGHGPLAPASAGAAPPSASPSSQAAVAAASSSSSSSSASSSAGGAGASSSSSSASSSAGGAGGSVASASGAGERRETSLGPRAAAPRGPRKCARKTRHAEGGPEPGARDPAPGLTRYLPIAGVSSVVALAPYVNKTVTGDCLPVLDMETGHIGAYVVLVDQTGNVADLLRAAAPAWSRRTLLPEHARNCVRPPDYPTPPASEWNSLWMTPVGNMLFDQGTLVGALDFHGLRSRHPWSREQGAPAPAGDAPAGHGE
ncbi:RL2_TRL [Human alphaherpesvirus 2]|nr:RL2 [Human alphaherpesvirus 2]ATD86424.1 RL2_TRL [Human alphaherpesvirus 2]